MTELATTTNVDIVERVITAGDLSRLQPAERVQLYAQTCKSLGLNPLTRPFEYIQLNGKLTLYARKDATDQLRKINGVSISKPEVQQVDDLIIVTVTATDSTGRTDSDLGVVKKSDMQNNIANAMMKAVTKAKRRVTLSICGLGFLDESEVDSIPDARPVFVKPDTGEIVKATAGPTWAPEQPATNGNGHSEPGSGRMASDGSQMTTQQVRTEAIANLKMVIAEAKRVAEQLETRGESVTASELRGVLAQWNKQLNSHKDPAISEIEAATLAITDATPELEAL